MHSDTILTFLLVIFSIYATRSPAHVLCVLHVTRLDQQRPTVACITCPSSYYMCIEPALWCQQDVVHQYG